MWAMMPMFLYLESGTSRRLAAARTQRWWAPWAWAALRGDRHACITTGRDGVHTWHATPKTDDCNQVTRMHTRNIDIHIYSIDLNSHRTFGGARLCPNTALPVHRRPAGERSGPAQSRHPGWTPDRAADAGDEVCVLAIVTQSCANGLAHAEACILGRACLQLLSHPDPDDARFWRLGCRRNPCMQTPRPARPFVSPTGDTPCSTCQQRPEGFPE